MFMSLVIQWYYCFCAFPERSRDNEWCWFHSECLLRVARAVQPRRWLTPSTCWCCSSHYQVGLVLSDNGFLIIIVNCFNDTLQHIFTHGVMGRQIDPSWGGPIELFLIPASAPRLIKHSFIHSFIQSFIHSFVHSLIPCLFSRIKLYCDIFMKFH